MNRWFRFYDDVLNDPKVQRLSGDKFKTWINLLCLASKNGGFLPSLTDLTFALRISESKVISIVGEFCELNLLDIDETEMRARYSPHNWNGRQFKSDLSNERVKRYRQRHRNVTSAVTETPPDTEQIQIAESERKDGAAAPIVDLFPKPGAPPSEEKSYYDRSKEILGPKGNGLAAKLLKSQNKVIAKARAVVETASTKSDPVAYIGAVIRGAANPERSGVYGDDWG
jgi:hypothetical protein